MGNVHALQPAQSLPEFCFPVFRTLYIPRTIPAHVIDISSILYHAFTGVSLVRGRAQSVQIGTFPTPEATRSKAK